MVGTIAPAVRGRYTGYVALIAFTLALVATAVAVGVVLSWVGALMPAGPLGMAVVAIALLYVGYYVLFGRTPTLLPHRQMPVQWLRPELPVLSALHYGLVMGSSYTIPIRGGSMLVLGGIAAWLGMAWIAAAAFGLMAVIRAVPVVLIPLLSNDVASTSIRFAPRQSTLNLVDAMALAAIVGILSGGL